MKRWIIVEVTGDEEEELLPKFDLFPSCIEFYGDFRVVADWDDSEPKVGREYLASQEQTPDIDALIGEVGLRLLRRVNRGETITPERATMEMLNVFDAALGFHPGDNR